MHLICFALSFDTISIVNFEANETQSINNIVFNGSCAQQVTVRSTFPGGTAYLYKLSGVVNEDYLNIRDITITGGATFTSDSSNNLGNVFNWTIIPPAVANTYYWVGNSGNWSDPGWYCGIKS